MRGRKGEYERLLEGARRAGLHAGAHRRRAPRAHRQGAARALRAAHDRGRRRPSRATRRHRASAHRLARDRAAHRRGRRRGRDRAARRRRRSRRRSRSRSTSRAATAGSVFEELAPRNFSFNSPYGACDRCDGLGTRFEVDPELVVPDDDLSLADGAIAPWTGFRSRYFDRVLEAVADEFGFTHRHAVEEARQARHATRSCNGTGDRAVHVRYRNRYGRQRSYNTAFEGVVPWLERRHTDAESDRSRELIEGYMREVPCPACHGARLRPASLAVKVGGLNIYELGELSIAKAAAFLGELELSERDRMIAEARREGGQRAAALPPRRRPRLPAASTARRGRSPVARRSASGSRRRSAAGSSACSTSSTSRRSGCTSATTSA